MNKDKFTFQDNTTYDKHRCDTNFWHEAVNKLLLKHKLLEKTCDIQAGHKGTYPVFLVEDFVIKFFGHRPNWLNTFNMECVAHECLIYDDTILAPKVLAKGQLFTDTDEFWPYIISSKLKGQAWLHANLTYEEKNNIAVDIGQQLSKIHSLPINNILKHDHKWSKLNLNAAAKKSVLPKHLITQVDNFVDKLDPFDRCLVNGDIVSTHVFIKNGRLSGIIDWGDATVSDRHYELGKLLDTFDWDKQLLKTVLEASNWPIKKTFPRQALGLALYRQAVGLTQHNSFDVFYKLPHILPLEDIATLDELAVILFDV